MAQDPVSFFVPPDLPGGVMLKEPSHLCREDVNTLWAFWHARQVDGEQGPVFAGCDKCDQSKVAPKKLAQQKKRGGSKQQANWRSPEISSDESSSEDDTPNPRDQEGEEESEQEARRVHLTPHLSQNGAGQGHQSHRQDKCKVMPEPSLHLDDVPDGIHEGSQWLVVKDMDLPNSVAGTKEDRLRFLKGLCQEPAYKAMVWWLDANLV